MSSSQVIHVKYIVSPFDSKNSLTGMVCGRLQVELQEIVDFFLRPYLFYKSGAQIPRGVMLCGPPGTHLPSACLSFMSMM